jgi:hypothetical protein
METILAVRNGYANTAHALAAAVGGLPAAAAAAAALDAAGGALAGLLGRRTRLLGLMSLGGLEAS